MRIDGGAAVRTVERSGTSTCRPSRGYLSELNLMTYGAFLFSFLRHPPPPPPASALPSSHHYLRLFSKSTKKTKRKRTNDATPRPADFHGSWDATVGVNSPLHDRRSDPEPGWSLDGCVENWLSRGAPREEVNVGLAFHGRSFRNARAPGEIHGGADESAWAIDEGSPQYFVSCFGGRGRRENERGDIGGEAERRVHFVSGVSALASP